MKKEWKKQLLDEAPGTIQNQLQVQIMMCRDIKVNRKSRNIHEIENKYCSTTATIVPGRVDKQVLKMKIRYPFHCYNCFMDTIYIYID